MQKTRHKSFDEANIRKEVLSNLYIRNIHKTPIYKLILLKFCVSDGYKLGLWKPCKLEIGILRTSRCRKVVTGHLFSRIRASGQITELKVHSANAFLWEFDLCGNNFKIPTILHIFGSNEYHIS